MPRTSLVVVCPSCRAAVSVPSPVMGRRLNCTHCGSPFVPVPAGRTVLYDPASPADVASPPASRPAKVPPPPPDVLPPRPGRLPLLIAGALLAALLLGVGLLVAAAAAVILLRPAGPPAAQVPLAPREPSRPAETPPAPSPKTHAEPPPARTQPAKPTRASPELQAKRKGQIDAWIKQGTFMEFQPLNATIRAGGAFPFASLPGKPDRDITEKATVLLAYCYALPEDFDPQTLARDRVLHITGNLSPAPYLLFHPAFGFENDF